MLEHMSYKTLVFNKTPELYNDIFNVAKFDVPAVNTFKENAFQVKQFFPEPFPE